MGGLKWDYFYSLALEIKILDYIPPWIFDPCQPAPSPRLSRRIIEVHKLGVPFLASVGNRQIFSFFSTHFGAKKFSHLLLLCLHFVHRRLREGIYSVQCDQIGRSIGLWATFIDIWRFFSGDTVSVLSFAFYWNGNNLIFGQNRV